MNKRQSSTQSTSLILACPFAISAFRPEKHLWQPIGCLQCTR